MKIAFMFPGQSSRYPHMFDKLLALDSANKLILEEASDTLGRDFLAYYVTQRNDEQMFATNRDIQMGVFLANHMFLRTLQRRGIEADFSMGLSLGEWNHVVHSGALTFAQALPAIEQRGTAYDEGPRGAMASFFPVALEDLEPIIEKARAFGQLEAVNLNSPRQHVLAGDWVALEEALRLASEELYIEGVVIEREVPMHASMFAPVGAKFRQTLETLPFSAPKVPYLPNRLGQWVESPTREEYIDLLSTHVHMPVYWRASIDFLLEQHPDVTLVEVGPRAVLFNLLDRKWHKGVKKFCTDSKEQTQAHLETVIEALQTTSTAQRPLIPLTPSREQIAHAD